MESCETTFQVAINNHLRYVTPNGSLRGRSVVKDDENFTRDAHITEVPEFRTYLGGEGECILGLTLFTRNLKR